MKIARFDMIFKDLMGYYLGHHLPFKISKKFRNLLGLTYFNTKLKQPTHFKFSYYYIVGNPEAVVLDMVAHEIAHALVPFDDNGNYHNEIWQDKALELGCIAPAPYCTTILHGFEAVSPSEVVRLKLRCHK